MTIRIRKEGLRLPRKTPAAEDASSAVDGYVIGGGAVGAAPGGSGVVEPHTPGRPLEVGAEVRRAAAPAPASLEDDEKRRGARRAVMHALFKDVGKAGSTMQHPTGMTFTLDPKVASGDVRSPDAITIPLPEGHTTRHTADIHLELDNGARLVLDVLPSYARLESVKAHAYDALQLRRLDRCFSALVFLRCPGSGLTQEQVEGLGHGYDYIFGIDEEHLHSEMRYSALRGRVGAWLRAAAGS